MRIILRLLVPATLCLVTLRLAGAEFYRITVAAENVDRAGQVIAFVLPPDLPSGVVLHDSVGREIALQVDSDRTARFIVSAQSAGRTNVFTLARGQPLLSGRAVQVIPEPSEHRNEPAPAVESAVTSTRLMAKPGKLRLSVGGAPVLYYQMDQEALRPGIHPTFQRAGYLDRVAAPSGKWVRDDNPAADQPARVIWSQWSKARFEGHEEEFLTSGEGSGRVEFVQVDRTWNGPVHGGFTAWHRFVDGSRFPPSDVLNETWEIIVYNLATEPTVTAGEVAARMFDLELTQTCATAASLILPAHSGGGLALRGRGNWVGKEKSFVLSSDGENDRMKVNGTRVRWCEIGGEVDGTLVGIAVLDHPSNYRAPQPVHLDSDNPTLSFAPSQLGDWAIEPGKPYAAKYRFIVTEGAPNRAVLDAYWNAYAKPATVTVDSP